MLRKKTLPRATLRESRGKPRETPSPESQTPGVQPACGRYPVAATRVGLPISGVLAENLCHVVEKSAKRNRQPDFLDRTLGIDVRGTNPVVP